MKRPFFLFFPLMIVLCSLLIMLLWNNVLVELIHVPQVRFFQAVGILLLSRILFAGLPSWRTGPREFYRYGPHFRREWMNMNDEERQRLKEAWKRRCAQGKDQP
ncbi:MAG TPA: hypothetical protein VK666_19305 [Chryseolinea sp.]|nr:hypothetical protein [Chryseolinea sp.]